jgi:Protein of unknown function (DUF992)
VRNAARHRAVTGFCRGCIDRSNAAAASFAQISAEHVQAGTLNSDISGVIGFIIGSQKALYCSFVPALAGPPQFYSGEYLGGAAPRAAVLVNTPLPVPRGDAG